MKYFVMKPGEASPFEFSLDHLQAGLKTGTISPDWKVRVETDRGDNWITVADVCAGLYFGRDGLHHVFVTGKTVSFPPVCPHCLRSASQALPIQSSGRFAGYYVFYTKWKH